MLGGAHVADFALSSLFLFLPVFFRCLCLGLSSSAGRSQSPATVEASDPPHITFGSSLLIHPRSVLLRLACVNGEYFGTE